MKSLPSESSKLLFFRQLIEDRKIINLFWLRRFFQAHFPLCEVEFEFLAARCRTAIEGPAFLDDVQDQTRVIMGYRKLLHQHRQNSLFLCRADSDALQHRLDHQAKDFPFALDAGDRRTETAGGELDLIGRTRKRSETLIQRFGCLQSVRTAAGTLPLNSAGSRAVPTLRILYSSGLSPRLRNSSMRTVFTVACAV